MGHGHDHDWHATTQKPQHAHGGAIKPGALFQVFLVLSLGTLAFIGLVVLYFNQEFGELRAQRTEIDLSGTHVEYKTAAMKALGEYGVADAGADANSSAYKMPLDKATERVLARYNPAGAAKK